MIAFGDIVEELLIKGKNPSNLSLSDKNGFFGIEAHIKTPVEVVGIALLASLFKSYQILIVDSFQLMEYEESDGNKGASPKEVSDAVGKTRHELKQIARTFNISFDVVLCSEFFKAERYEKIFRYVSGMVEESPEIRKKLMRTIPEGQNKNDLTYATHELATIYYMALARGANVKVGQPRERLYDESIAFDYQHSGVLNFAYLIPFYALGTASPEEVTPYKPTSGTKNGGKRILIDEFNIKNYNSIANCLQAGPLQAQMSLNRLALAAGLTSQATTPSIDQLPTAFLKFLVRPYDICKIDSKIEKATTFK